MFNIQYKTWKNICKLYFDLKVGSQSAYLQWFPFTKLSDEDKQYIVSESFFNQFIQNPAFLINPAVVHQTENFLQKSDGSFRDSSLVTPVLYLVLQCIGKEISIHYRDMRPNNVSVYYAGNYSYDRVIYKTDYSDFYKHINAYAENYNYFIKTDITNFYTNINVDYLMDRIDKICNAAEVCFSQTTLQIYKSFLLLCGHGRFPLIENSVASSYLATFIYLDEIDRRLADYLQSKIVEIQDFQMVRYVDDLYILFSSSVNTAELTRIYNEIRNVYSSILKEFGLTINTKKCCLRKTTSIHEELKTLLYHEYYSGIRGDIEKIFDGRLSDFLMALYLELLFDSVDNEKYNSMIDKFFSSDEIEFTAQEVLNYYVYDNDSSLQSKEVQDTLLDLVRQSNSFISLDPKRLTIMIMRSGNDAAIKAFLKNLFNKNRSDEWNSYDTTVAINYLIQSGFKHIDLLSVIEKRSPMLYDYYFFNCRSSFIPYLKRDKYTNLSNYISADWKAYFLYFMYLCEMQKRNYMAAYAYYKNYFDRVTADIEFKNCTNSSLKKPNYKGFYKEGPIKKVYSGITDSDSIIEKAHSIRNSNPLSHSSSDMLEKYTSAQIQKTIEDLSQLIFTKITQSSSTTV